MYYIQQTSGKHVSAINAIVSDFRSGKIDAPTAFKRFVPLYRACRGNDGAHSATVLAELEQGRSGSSWHGPDGDRHNICIHLRHYANLWDEGDSRKMARQCDFLERIHGGTFEVCYEY